MGVPADTCQPKVYGLDPEAGLLKKKSCLAPTLVVTKFIIVTDMILPLAPGEKKWQKSFVVSWLIFMTKLKILIEMALSNDTTMHLNPPLPPIVYKVCPI